MAEQKSSRWADGAHGADSGDESIKVPGKSCDKTLALVAHKTLLLDESRKLK